MKICGAANGCPFSQEQTTGGCPRAETCPGYSEPGWVTTSNRTVPEPPYNSKVYHYYTNDFESSI